MTVLKNYGIISIMLVQKILCDFQFLYCILNNFTYLLINPLKLFSHCNTVFFRKY